MSRESPPRPRPRRSMLYLPGANARALEKARTLDVDCLIFDLEDSVAPEAKAAAREGIAAALSSGGYGSREVILRTNALDGTWGPDDARLAATAGPDGVLVPKVASRDDVIAARERLSEAGVPQTTPLWVMIETPRAILDCLAIAETAKVPGVGLVGLVLGTNDLAKETGVRLDEGRAPLHAWLSMAVAAARAAGLVVIDGVYNDFRDEAGFRQECREGRRLGMDGKTLIHPGQIAPANEIFAPSQEEIAWAELVVSTFAKPENADKGVVAIEGRMVERLHLEMAERTLAIARVIAERGV